MQESMGLNFNNDNDTQDIFGGMQSSGISNPSLNTQSMGMNMNF